MCRFILYLGPKITLKALITEPVNSLIHQSFNSIETRERLNGDGFGVAWYESEISPQPAAFRSISPAWNNRNLFDLARVTQSPCVLAHVRAATPGLPVAEANCHPFIHDRLAFMHNGHIGGFKSMRRHLLEGLSNEAFNAVLGSTDSEHLFGLFIDRYIASSHSDSADRLAEALRAAVRDTIELAGRHGVAEASYFNIAVSDGSAAAVMRYSTDPHHTDSLFLNRGGRYECVGGICRMVEANVGSAANGTTPVAVMVSSERLSADASWERIPENTMIRINAGGKVRIGEAMT